MAQKEAFGVAVVGAGQMVQTHMTSIGNIPWFELRALADVNLSSAQAQAEKHNIPFSTSDYREVVSRPDVDVVLVCTPSAFHADVVVASARNGKDIFCESLACQYSQ